MRTGSPPHAEHRGSAGITGQCPLSCLTAVLSPRVYHPLARHARSSRDLRTVRDLADLSRTLRPGDIRNIGVRGIGEIETAVHDRHYPGEPRPPAPHPRGGGGRPRPGSHDGRGGRTPRRAQTSCTR